MTIRPLSSRDWPAVRRIYLEGIDSGHATFETAPPDWEQWNGARHRDARLVAERRDEVVGFAALTPISSRPVYRGVCEVMVYVAAEARGVGIGTGLLHALVRASEDAGVWTLQASIFPENAASIGAHLNAGFREVGRRERIGRFPDGRWRDTVLLERRSDRVGID
jgi:L-amino acid N-acyltransferase YncA